LNVLSGKCCLSTCQWLVWMALTSTTASTEQFSWEDKQMSFQPHI